ncbi:HNH endonuclease signature motif containing protein [Nocardioides hankookensis]
MTAIATPRHRVSVAVAHTHVELDAVADASTWSMDVAETASTLVEVTRLEARVAELKARVAMHADEIEVGDAAGATSTANWLAHETKQTRPAAHRVVRFGYQLDTHPQVRTALAAGDVLADQAHVIIDAITALPEDLDPDVVTQAVAHLVGEAAHHDARGLKRLGDRLLDVIDPAAADAHEARILEREEQEAAQACRLTMVDDGHGKVHGRFTLPTLHGAQLRKILLALAAPKHRAATEGAGVERRPGPERMGRAFAELIERVRAKDLPQVGGTDAAIVVTISYESLIGQLEQAGVLDTGERISPGTARRLACTARILPAVLGGRSEVLDLGRSRRFHTKAQRIALALRDKGCTAPGCDWPPGPVSRPPRPALEPRRADRHRPLSTPLPPTPRPRTPRHVVEITTRSPTCGPGPSERPHLPATGGQ